MTFLVAFAQRGVAVLASDTRTTWRPEPDAPASWFDDTRVKLHEVAGGWIASGPSVCWRESMVAAIGDSADVRGAVQAWAPGALQRFEAEEPAAASIMRERQLTFVVGAGAGVCYRYAFDWSGQPMFATALPGEALALCPNGSDPAHLQRLLNGFQRAIRHAAVPDVLEALAVLYGAVYAHCGPNGTVSPLITVGLVGADGRRELVGPVSHDVLATLPRESLVCV